MCNNITETRCPTSLWVYQHDQTCCYVSLFIFYLVMLIFIPRISYKRMFQS